jgi:hypothetical protein
MGQYRPYQLGVFQLKDIRALNRLLRRFQKPAEPGRKETKGRAETPHHKDGNPYTGLSPDRFWRTGVQQSDPANMPGIHTPKFLITRQDTIVTMGSCFAQHIANWLRDRDFNVPFYDSVDNIRAKSFSANYGNIYTVKQALQLVQEARSARVPSEAAWSVDGGVIDPLRPAQFEAPFQNESALRSARATHLKAVLAALNDLDVLVFTLGLTEAWRVKSCGTVLPVAPGVIAGQFDQNAHEFVNFRYDEILTDLRALCAEIRDLRGGREFRMVLTVSPVPLTATAAPQHVLCASTYSKSVLRAVAGDFCEDHDDADYFPSFELVTNPGAYSANFEDNLRSVRPASVASVMTIFERLCLEGESDTPATSAGIGDVDCEEALLDAFAGNTRTAGRPNTTPLLVVGNSHLGGARDHALANPFGQTAQFAMLNFLRTDPFAKIKTTRFRTFKYRDNVRDQFADVVADEARTLIIVGCGLMGDGIIRAHGDLRAGFPGCNGRKISPNVPIVHEVSANLIKFYDSATRQIAQNIRKLEDFCDFEHVFWIAAPDMCEATARFRLGDEFVESGSLVHHREAYARSLRAALKSSNRVQVVCHPTQELCEASGFSKDKFAAHRHPWDVHCNTAYFDNAFDQVWTALRTGAP